MLSDMPWPRPHRINQFTIPSPPTLTLLEGEWGNWVVTTGRIQNDGVEVIRPPVLGYCRIRRLATTNKVAIVYVATEQAQWHCRTNIPSPQGVC